METDGRISFYIHPAEVSGDTLDYWVEGDTLMQKAHFVSADSPFEVEKDKHGKALSIIVSSR